MYQFRDPIHGFIQVSSLERKIIDSAPFQRLRNIKQLATTYLIYHGAEHTRFGHSIGVMHLVSRVFDSVVKKKDKLFNVDETENATVVKWYRQILRIIALTHDLGHAPFSHASEKLFAEELEHEDYTRMIILETVIAEHINEIGAAFAAEYGNQYNITPELIWMIYSDKGENTFNEDYIMPDYKFLQSLMDGELDCDKMDYLLRDAYYCGVSYGKYDLDRFISTITVYQTDREEGNIMQLAIEKGGVQALEEFILARYFMFIQVYFHKTRRFFDKVLVKCLLEILQNKIYPVDIEEYLMWDDTVVFQHIKKNDSEYKRMYLERETWTCVYETPAHANKSETQSFNGRCATIRSAVGSENMKIDRVDKAAHKFMPTFLSGQDDSGQGLPIMESAAKSMDIMECSLILQGIRQPINIQRIYVKHDFVVKASELMNSFARPMEEDE